MSDEVRNFIVGKYGDAFPGHIVLWSKQTRQSRFFSSTEIEELVQTIVSLAPREDVYLALGTQSKRLRASQRGGWQTVAAIPGFFADIDFASDKHSSKRYPKDQAETLQILRVFSPAPTAVVGTGNGLHVHWDFNTPAVLETAKNRGAVKTASAQFQRRLLEHFRKHDREIDNVGDLTRNYRIPGTFNHKGSEPSPVRLIDHHPSCRYTTTELSPADDAVILAEANASESSPLADHEKIRGECAWYHNITGPGAADCPEPDWYAAASITARCNNGRDIFLGFSRQYPGFDEEEAEKKFQRGRDEAGPRTCEAIERDLGHDCSACPHRGQITSPIQMGFSPQIYEPGKDGPLALGFTRDGSYALRDQTRSIIILASANQLLSAQWLMGLAPSPFWARRYPARKTAFSSYAAGEALIAACKAKGPFDPSRVRGRGVWIENGQTIINLGGEIPSGLRHVYLCFQPIELDPASQFDAERLLRLLQLFPWRDQNHAILLLGWLAIAPICGALSWRPHCFIYGPPKAGKSTLHTLASRILSPLAVSTTGDSTEAGIRQTVGPDSLPVILDEFESDQRRSRQQSIVMLARSASSGEVPIFRGTPEGKAMQFSLRVTFFFSGINPAGLSPADASRILLLELQMHENNTEIGRQITSEIAHFGECGPAWCGYMASRALQIIPAKDAFELAMPGIDARLRTNIATLLGGAFVALHGRPPSDDEAAVRAAQFSATTAQHADDEDRDDAFECLHHLFAYVIDGNTVGQWLALEQQNRDPNARVRQGSRILASLDIVLKLKGKDVGLFLLRGSPGLDRIFANTKWSAGAWAHAIRKLDAAFSPRDPVYFPNISKKARGIGLPLELIPEAVDEEVGGFVPPDY